MKNRLIAVCAVLLALVLLFAGCGAASNSGKRTDSYPASPGYAADSSNYYDDYDYPDAPYSPEAPSYESDWKGDSGSLGELTEGMMNANSNSEFDKIIYTANVDLETLEFEETVAALYKLIEANGAFIETSSVSGTNYNAKYYGYNSYRTAYFTIRVPKENFAGLTGSLSSIGNVTQSRTSADNITASFLDTESRLKAYRTEESNLLDMMEKADTVEDMITIQDRLSWVRYEIESLTSQLNNWQRRVDYSTLNLNVTEVKEYTEEPVEEKTFGEEIRDGFNSSVKWLKQALRDIVVFVVSALPVLVLPLIILIPAGIVLLIVLLAVRGHRKKAKKNAAEGK
jgi:hypothetical protein